jgi:protein phosphatase 1L
LRPQNGLFGIFDSHEGPGVGRYVQNHLFENILNGGGVRLDPAGATRDGYLLTDRNILEGPLKGGCSAVTAMLLDHGSRLIVANVGDARAVLSKNGRAVQLSVDHDPGSPTERANVERRGGMVIQMPGRFWCILSYIHEERKH